MRNKITTVLVLWVSSFIMTILTCEAMDIVFVLSLVVFGICSYELRYKNACYDKK